MTARMGGVLAPPAVDVETIAEIEARWDEELPCALTDPECSAAAEVRLVTPCAHGAPFCQPHIDEMLAMNRHGGAWATCHTCGWRGLLTHCRVVPL